MQNHFAHQWWGEGAFRILRWLVPLRLQWIVEQCRNHPLYETGEQPLRKMKIMDAGCGGGFLAEPLARLGAQVLAVDSESMAIHQARQRAQQQGLSIEYRTASVEADMSGWGQADVVVASEILEHLCRPQKFFLQLPEIIRPGGFFVGSTPNRTWQSYLGGIWLAEEVWQWIPRGTHQWEKFLRPEEISLLCAQAGLGPPSFQGMEFSPRTHRWRRCADLSLAYLFVANSHPEGPGV